MMPQKQQQTKRYCVNINMFYELRFVNVYFMKIINRNKEDFLLT